MKQSRRQPSTGFTIIEVMIVLAIAAFILIVIFIAIPSLQRNSRNFTRKHAVELTSSALEQFNNQYGRYPTNAADAATFEAGNPEIGNRFDLSFRPANSSHNYIPPFDTIAIQYGHWCNRYGDGDNANDPIAGNHANPNEYAAWTLIEPNDPYSVFCIDNHGR